MIRCRGVTKRFGDFIAVDDVSLDVSSGICALVGPNGAGKSTLLKLLTGMLAPDAGEVSIAGLDVGLGTLAIRRLIGVVPEDLGLFGLLTIREHLELCGGVYGLTTGQTRERADSLLRLLGLTLGRDTLLDRCSHGMRKKTALAMALIHNPRALFLDEPFEGIDPVSSEAIHKLLLSASGRGVTVFLTSHTLPAVTRLATDIVMIRAGRLVWRSGGAIPPERSLEEIYFSFVEPAATEQLSWLGCSPS